MYSDVTMPLPHTGLPLEIHLCGFSLHALVKLIRHWNPSDISTSNNILITLM